jgi:type IV pilus assembly protein PilC
MKFRCACYDKLGAPVERVIDAGSAADAAELARREGFFVAGVAAAEEGGLALVHRGGRGDAESARIRVRGSRHKHLAGFMRQMSVLVSTGTPVVDALCALESQARDPGWRRIVGDVRQRVEDGSQLSEALEVHPRYFDTVARSLVRAGESGGKLEVMLNRLAELTNQQLKIRQTVLGALVYPILLIAVSLVVLGVMLCFVLPRFAGLFQTLDVPLPPTTRVLMGVSDFLVGYWWGVLLGLGGGVVGLVVWMGTPAGKRMVDTALVWAPFFGRLFRSFCTARIARLMGLLLESKVPLLEALELTRAAVSNVHYVELLARTHDSLTRGEAFSVALGGMNGGAGGSGGGGGGGGSEKGREGLIHGSVREAVKNGERSGQVGSVLTSMADFLDDENQMLIKSLTGLLEPVILITLGVVVGLVATSMFLPLFDLTAMAGGG